MAVDVSWVRAREGALQDYSEFSTVSAGTADPSRPALALGRGPLGMLLAAGFVLAVAGFNHFALEQFRHGDAAAIAQENGLLENTQLLVMLWACALFLFAGVRGLGAVRVSGVGLALLVAAAFIREVDFNSLSGVHGTLDRLIGLGLRDWLMELLGVIAVVYLLAHVRYFWGLVRLGLRWQAWPCVAALALFALSEIYLDNLTGAGAHFWEELVETNGYILFALAAWKHVQLIGHHDLDAPVLRRRRMQAVPGESAAV